MTRAGDTGPPPGAGDEIGAASEPMQIVRALARRIAPVAHQNVVAVFVFDATRARLLRHAIVDGRELPVSEIDLGDFESYAARTLRERREICIDSEFGGRPAARIPGTDVTHSMWFGPITRGEDLLGVLSVQSSHLAAYGEAERAQFRILADEVSRALVASRDVRK